MAFLLDEGLAQRLEIEQLAALDDHKRRGKLPPGMRWATDAEDGIDREADLADSQAATEQLVRTPDGFRVVEMTDGR